MNSDSDSPKFYANYSEDEDEEEEVESKPKRAKLSPAIYSEWLLNS